MNENTGIRVSIRQNKKYLLILTQLKEHKTCMSKLFQNEHKKKRKTINNWPLDQNKKYTHIYFIDVLSQDHNNELQNAFETQLEAVRKNVK